VTVATSSAKEQRQREEEAMKLFDWACKEGEVDSCYFAAGHHLNPGKYLEASC
jgi:hypothetical protein